MTMDSRRMPKKIGALSGLTSDKRGYDHSIAAQTGKRGGPRIGISNRFRVLGRPVAPIGVASDLAAVEQVLQGGAGVCDAQGLTHLVRGLQRASPLEVTKEARHVAEASPERGTRGRTVGASGAAWGVARAGA